MALLKQNKRLDLQVKAFRVYNPPFDPPHTCLPAGRCLRSRGRGTFGSVASAYSAGLVFLAKFLQNLEKNQKKYASRTQRAKREGGGFSRVEVLADVAWKNRGEKGR